MKSPVKVEYVLVTLLFVFTRAVYYMFTPFVNVMGDSIDYLGFAYLFSEGIIPDLGVIPPLYPLIMSVLKDLTLIQIFQSLLFYSSSIFLLSVLEGIYKKTKPVLFYILVFMLCLFITDGMILMYETIIQTESIFASLLLLFTGFFYKLIYKKELKYLSMVGLIAFLLAFCRSNGILFYPILIAIIIYCWFAFKTSRKKVIIHGLVLFTSLNLVWCFLNYESTETFFFGNPYRIKRVAKHHMLNQKSNHLKPLVYTKSESLIYPFNHYEEEKHLNYDYLKNIKPKGDMLANYFYDISEERASFFNEMIPVRLDHFYKPNIFNDELTYYDKFVKYEDDKEKIKSFIFDQLKDLKVENDKSVESISLLFKIGNWLENAIARSLIWHILFFISAIIIGIKLIQRKIKWSDDIFRLFVLAMMVYGNLLMITMFHVRLVSRYQYVFLFLNILLSIELVQVLLSRNHKIEAE